MLARERYPFLSREGRAVLLVRDALGAMGTALREIPAYGPPRLSLPAVGRADSLDSGVQVSGRRQRRTVKENP